MFALFPAQLSEVDVCYVLIDKGRAFQRKQGFVQWTDDYPQREHVADDIETGKGYALKDEAGRIAGYICIDFGGEPAYDAIKEQWRSKEPSGVLHRMAISPDYRGQGLGGVLLRECERICQEKGVTYLRADTSPDNTRMQHVFEKEGYVRCGFVELRGSDKIAYDKLFG